MRPPSSVTRLVEAHHPRQADAICKCRRNPAELPSTSASVKGSSTENHASIVCWLLDLPVSAQAACFAAAALATGRRVLGYQPHRTLAHPLLWTLHFAYLGIAIGFALLAAAAFGLAPGSAGWRAPPAGALRSCCIWGLRAASGVDADGWQ